MASLACFGACFVGSDLWPLSGRLIFLVPPPLRILTLFLTEDQSFPLLRSLLSSIAKALTAVSSRPFFSLYDFITPLHDHSLLTGSRSNSPQPVSRSNTHTLYPSLSWLHVPVPLHPTDKMNPSVLILSAFVALAAARPFKFPDSDGFSPIDTIDMK